MRLTIRRPDDWHVHLRDGAALGRTVADSARQMGRAIVMPNLTPPITTVGLAAAYRERILAARPEGSVFEPLMTLYLTDETTIAEVEAAGACGFVSALKLYPAGATTNSAAGVTDIEGRYPIFEAMAEAGLKLLIHGEVTDPEVDIFDRERVFLGTFLRGIVESFPGLGVVLEHITSAAAVEFVQGAPGNLAATITAHHLLFNRNHMLAGGIRPHYFCLPILKREQDRRALVEAATGGDPRFFLGTDSAPHSMDLKESACGCAGSYTAHAAMELYAQAFEDAGALDRLEAFASHHGADFYGLPRSEDVLTLERKAWSVPERLDLGGTPLIPLMAGERLAWSIVS